MVIWLTSVRADGTPQPAPVWFLWDGKSFLIYSQPKARKVRNLQANPRVALNLNSDSDGGQVAVCWGEARLDPLAPPAKDVPAYLEKYRQGITDIGMDPDSFSQAYSLAIRIVPNKVRED
jgi:PPOX class probable F420-dependent enzyme